MENKAEIIGKRGLILGIPAGVFVGIYVGIGHGLMAGAISVFVLWAIISLLDIYYASQKKQHKSFLVDIPTRPYEEGDQRQETTEFIVEDKKLDKIILAGGAFTLVFISLIGDSDVGQVFQILFFLVFGLLGLLFVVLRNEVTTLTLSPVGIEYKTLFIRKFVTWDSILLIEKYRSSIELKCQSADLQGHLWAKEFVKLIGAENSIPIGIFAKDFLESDLLQMMVSYAPQLKLYSYF